MPYLLQHRVNAYTGDFVGINERKARELPYHLQHACKDTELREVLTQPAILNYFGRHKKFAELSVLWGIETDLSKVFAAYTEAAERMDKGMAQYRYCSFVVGFAQTVRQRLPLTLCARGQLISMCSGTLTGCRITYLVTCACVGGFNKRCL